VIDHIAEEAFLEGVRRKSGLLRQPLESLVAAHPDIFQEVRGSGLMLGLKCKIPNSDFLKACYDAELITVPAADNVIRLLPPLNLSEKEISAAVARLDKAAKACETCV
jgi:acetylornithine/N-succinyldiaminopimelate aminotransferase